MSWGHHTKGELTRTLKETVMSYLNMLIMWTDLEKQRKASIMTVSNPAEIQTWSPLNKSEYCYARLMAWEIHTGFGRLTRKWQHDTTWLFNLNQMKKYVAWSNSLQNDEWNNSTAASTYFYYWVWIGYTLLIHFLLGITHVIVKEYFVSINVCCSVCDFSVQYLENKKKGKEIPLQAQCGPEEGWRYSYTLPWPRH